MSAPILKAIAVHGIIGNAPRIISVDATASPPGPRMFYGTGSPSAATLATGNGKYNSPQSGFIINASLASGGSGYVPGDPLAINGGTAITAAQIKVLQVDGNGAITVFDLSTTGEYSAYPTTSASTTGGSGSGATFNLNLPPPDYYLDTTNTTSPALYVCTTHGTNSTSAWARISGGINFQSPKELDPTVPVSSLTLVYISPGNPLATTGLTDLVADTIIQAMPGIWLSLQSVPAQITVGGTIKYNMPQVLASGTVSGTPLKGDADNVEIFWIPIAGIMNCG